MGNRKQPFGYKMETVHWTNRRNKAARLSKPRSKLLLKRLNGMYPDLKLHIVKFSTKPYKI